MENEGIKNLTEYIDELGKLGHHLKYPFRFVYRGVYELQEEGKKSKRYLSPSLQFKEDGSLCKYENDMIQEMQRLRPTEFEDLTDLALLGKLQHFRLPTRLMDFSFSPYVALWFALNDANKDKTGEAKVYCALARPQEDVARVIARIAINMTSEKYNSERSVKAKNHYVEDVLFAGMDAMQKENRLRDLLLNIFDKKKQNGYLIFTYPHFNERREQNQQSVFAIYINCIYDTLSQIDLLNCKDINCTLKGAKLSGRFVFESKIYNPLEDFLDSSKKLQKNIFEIKINYDYREKIIRELSQLGINETYLFPENLESTARDVIEYAKDMCKSQF